MNSSRFPTAAHMLAVLASRGPGEAVCSGLIAQSVNTHPVVIRRLMCMLEKAGLVRAITGRAGGFALARAPQEITLADIYLAVETAAIFRRPIRPPQAACPVAARMGTALARPMASAETAMVQALSATRLSEVVAGLGREPV